MPTKKTLPKSIQKIKDVNSNLSQQFNKKHSRSLIFAGASGTANILVGSGKLVLGLLSLSLITCVSAFYTFGMVSGKYMILKGSLKPVEEQHQYYRIAGVILIVTSLLYSGYSLRLLFNPVTVVYDMNVALIIALVTFIEIGIGIRGVIVELKNHSLLIHGLKMINLASAFVSLVLTQTAILSFSDSQTDLHPTANGLFGVLMGFCAAFLGCLMLIRIQRIDQGKQYRHLSRKVNKIIKKEKLLCQISALKYVEDAKGKPQLQVKLLNKTSKEEFQILHEKVKIELEMELIPITHKGEYQDD